MQCALCRTENLSIQCTYSMYTLFHPPVNGDVPEIAFTLKECKVIIPNKRVQVPESVHHSVRTAKPAAVLLILKMMPISYKIVYFSLVAEERGSESVLYLYIILCDPRSDHGCSLPFFTVSCQFAVL